MSSSSAVHPAHELLLRAHSPSTAERLFTDKIVHRPLLLRKTSPPPNITARDKRRADRLRKTKAQAQRRSQTKPKPLTASERRKLCLDEIPKHEAKWDIYEPLRNLWIGYINDILGLQEGSASKFLIPQSAGPTIASADLHGAVITVVRSRCVGRVGVRGTVVQDRKSVFVVVTTENKVKTLPKEHTIFQVELPLLGKDVKIPNKPLVFEIQGGQFQHRASERARKSFKLHLDPGL